jgi:hypothetical protein
VLFRISLILPFDRRLGLLGAGWNWKLEEGISCGGVRRPNPRCKTHTHKQNESSKWTAKGDSFFLTSVTGL